MASRKIGVVVVAALVLLCGLAVPVSHAAHGVDVSNFICQGMTLETWKCLRNLGHTFAIVEAWNGGYQFNSAVAKCVSDAWAAGFAHVDVYAFMCNQCRGNTPPENAVDVLVNSLKSAGVRFGQLWIDVEQCDGCWSSLEDNFDFVTRVVRRAANLGIDVGVYSSVYEWQETVGKSSGLQDRPLWYAHYDGVPAFSDSWAYQFGGWSRPNMKQYAGTTNQCGVGVDLSWYPD